MSTGQPPPPRGAVAFLKRFWAITRESHSMFGMLPGFYDGWLLDHEGVVKDPFTRSERAAALGLTLSVNFIARYITLALMDTERNRALMAKMPQLLQDWWDTVVEGVLAQLVNRLVGGEAVKQILQEDWDQAASPEKRRKSAHAMLYCVLCTAATTLAAAATRRAARTKQTLGDTLALSPSSGLVQDALVIEPTATLLCVYVSYMTGKPFGGVSYAARKSLPL
eukprot:TRINITY_DN14326_c0_g1_i1.p1 TRINITY_DN14326_c0_g1~~TRINITY_DN14326_c0_g1_i1.p1  ORF type:complete len:258 (+),score=44.84 TRINITY_DN14326_c0_g1_i1:106-774(+)